MSKKIISLLCLCLVIFNIVFPKCAYCEDLSYGSKITMDEATVDQQTFQEDTENGSSNVNGDNKGYNITDSTTNSILKNLIKILNIIPSMAKGGITLLSYDKADKESNKKYGESFTIQKLVYNKISLFDINFFHRHEQEGNLQKSIKDSIAKFYYLIRNIAIVLSLLVLIYAGIRMAMSTLADTKAKFKMILKDWVISFIILILTPYFMTIVTNVSETAVETCENILCTMFEDDDERNIEERILDKSTTSTNKGWSIVIPTITYWILTFYQVAFFLIYGKRLLISGVLVVISPLITITYSIDKAGDGQAQALKTWMAEYTMNVFVQPLHAMVYMIFMAMASHIMEAAPLLSVLFLTTLTRVEKLVRGLFRLKDGMTTGEMQKTTQKLKKL